MRIIRNIVLVVIVFLIGLCILMLFRNNNDLALEKTYNAYISNDNNPVILYDLEYNKNGDIYRGSEVILYDEEYTFKEKEYVKIRNNDKEYLVLKQNITLKKEEIIKEKELYVRTSTTIYTDNTSPRISGYVSKGEKVEVLGYDKIDLNGIVYMYKIKYNDIIGFVYSKYLVETKELADKYYDENGLLEYMNKMGNSLGGGTASLLDYYPYEKPNFENNIMPDEVRSLYINSGAVKNIDKYIDFAKENNINAFVIDIKDNTSPAYNSPVMKDYSKTNYEKALNDYEDYKKYVKKAIDAGIYVIGRITTFKDSYYVADNPSVAIKNSNGEPFSHNGSYWPSVYNRDVWEFNVSLAIEAVEEIGFNEIQFDYVRFPDRTTNLEKNRVINLGNTYNESKASALQTFIYYACDKIHERDAYVSIDVFGESASNYVTAYGQFWPAISNIADVISGMPYPDHFNAHEYGIKEVVWTVPYKLLSKWGSYVKEKQEIIPTPAKVRTWIQTYNATKNPKVIYDDEKLIEQITALYDNELTGGYMTWNSGSSLDKYKEVSYAFRKVYQ